ncbi:MAG: PfkB family carbohydrate kinase [Candidatus Gracilibacteria bacterium]|jgi:adenosine kinase|nr:PfkB family carbohydrate kinase [Candidatus Gracilibacteria bacterium]
MNRKVAVVGNTDITHIMSMNSLFKDAILPSYLNNLSVSFQPELEELHLGGAASDVAYNLNLLGITPFLFSVLGVNFQEFYERFEKNGITTKYIELHDKLLSPSSYILNDKNLNQITIFSSACTLDHNYCMDFKDLTKDDVDLAILCSNTQERMISFSRDAQKRGIPYIFDPGQSITSINDDNLYELTFNSIGVIVNAYEYTLLLKKLGRSVEDLTERLDFVVRTKGLEGSEIFTKNHFETSVPAILVMNAEPTACGDAFRAGFLLSYLDDKENFERALKYGTVAASFALEKSGTQSHKYSLEEFHQRVLDHFPN